jgi:hypothetical protein
MTSIHNVLANGQTISGSAAVPLAEINGELASDVQYDVLVESVAGTPTTAKLQCKIQRWVDIGGGLEYEYGGQWVDMVDGTYQPFSLTATGTSNQAANIRYLNAFSIADFASVLADQTLAAPRLVTRKVVGGMRTRIVLTPTFTGGTTPSFKVSATATARY